jgi:hypothetical protein
MPRTSNSCQKAVMAQAPNRIPTPMVKAPNRTPKPKSTGCRSGHGLRYNISHPHRASQLSPPHRQRAHPFLNIPRPVHLARRTTYPVSRRGGRRWCHLGKNTQQSARHPSGMTGRRVATDYNAALEIRTTAGPSSHVQCVLSGGPYAVWSHMRQVHMVWPPPRQATCPTRTWFGPSGWPFGHRVGGWVIHCPRRFCTRSPNTVESLGPGGDQSGAARRRHAGRSFSNTKMHSPAGVLYQ